LPRSSPAGTISIGGSVLGESVATPRLLGGGDTFDLSFAATVTDLGVVSGIVHIGNDAATAGVIRLANLQFQSLRPKGAGDITFTLTVDQDFAYAGPRSVDGAFSLTGSTTFTAFPQSSGGHVAGLLGVVLDPLPFAFAANSQGSFPQVEEFGTTGGLQGIPAAETMSLRLYLSLRLSDNTLPAGPRFDAPGGGEFISIGYRASAAPIPEPSTQILLGVSTLTLLGYAWQRRRATRHGRLGVP